MSISSFLQGWGITNSRTRETQAAKKYGVVSSTPGSITVRAPSGPEAAKVMDGMTLTGSRFTVINHKGGGVYEIKAEDWPG
jgi:hypothetical protein